MTLVATYFVAWAGIGAYAVRLIIREHRLVQRFGELKCDDEAVPHKLLAA
jgi:hypothetical protein